MDVVGIDYHSDVCYAARVKSHSSRPEVDALIRYRPDELDNNELLSDKRFVLAVPDELAIVKHLRMGGEDKARLQDHLVFELTQSVLEDEGRFLFDVYPAGRPEQHLGIIYRRTSLQQLAEDCGIELNDNLELSRFMLRSVALARGYLTFCHHAEGGLICLTELTAGAACICFIHNSHLVDVARLPTGRTDLTLSPEKERFAVDLKTLVNFRLAAIMDRGITLPLSALLMFGEVVDDDLRQVVRKYFPVGVGAPSINRGFLGSLSADDSVPPERFLTALGLTVN